MGRSLLGKTNYDLEDKIKFLEADADGNGVKNKDAKSYVDNPLYGTRCIMLEL